MATEIHVVKLDDIDHALGERTEADGTYALSWDGTSVELDLTIEHRSHLDAILRPYLDAGHAPERPVPTGRRQGLRADGKPRWREGSTKARMQAMRAWADTQPDLGPRSYMTPSGNYYASKRLRDRWAAHQATGRP